VAPPSYRRGWFDREAGANRITCLVGDETGALPIGRTFKVSRLLGGANSRHICRPSRANGLYVFVLEGVAEIAGAILTRHDSIALEGEDKVEIKVRTGGTDMLLLETRL
jgi:redox-sensitive bicupin YhaK (pirin superfamily)